MSLTSFTCGEKNPATGAECVFGHDHVVGYHHGTDGVNWPVTSAFPAPVAPEVVELAMLVGDPLGPPTAPRVELSADEESCRTIAHELATQDNRITAEPIFMVQEKVRDVGMDPEFCENIVWVSSEREEEVTSSEAARFQRFEAGTFDEEEDGDEEQWTRTGYRDRWENRQPFLTLKAAEAFRAREAHNFGETRVYVESAYRNPEWQLIRRVMGGANV